MSDPQRDAGTVHDPESACCLTSSNHHSPAFRTISSRALRCHLSTTLWRPCGALSRQWHPDTYPYARRHTHFVAASGLAIRRERVGHGVGDRGGVVGARHCRAPTAPYLPFRYNPSVTTRPPVVGAVRGRNGSTARVPSPTLAPPRWHGARSRVRPPRPAAAAALAPAQPRRRQTGCNRCRALTSCRGVDD